MSVEYRFQMKRGTTAQWAASTTVLLEGELGYDIDLDQFKTGDGVSLWGNLLWDTDPSRLPQVSALEGQVAEGQLPARLADASLNSTYAARRETMPARGAVMFSLDDNRAQNAELVAIHEALGQKITLAIVSDWVGQADRLTAAQILTYHQRGHEIANHSKTHLNMTTGTAATRGTEYDTCSDFIETLTGRRPETFVYPQGAWNATSDRELYTRFRSWALTCSAGSNFPVAYRLGDTAPRFYRLDLDSPANLDRALDLIRLAAKAPILVSFYTHWTDQAGTMTKAQYQSIAQLAADLNVPTVLPRDAFGSLSRFMDPSFESVSTNTWVRANTGAGTATRTAATPDAGLSGSYVMALTATNPDTAGVGQAVSLPPGKYRFSGRIKQVTGGTLVTNDFGIRLKYRDWSEAAMTQELFYPALPAVGTWGRFEQDFTVPDGAAFAYCDVFVTPGVAGRSGTLYVDHVDLRLTTHGGLG